MGKVAVAAALGLRTMLSIESENGHKITLQMLDIGLTGEFLL